MSQVADASNFNGLIIAISGKALIQDLYLEQINQHQIEIGLPQLDNADRHIMLSQNGNADNPIDLSKYSSIEIVEISQQPAPRQREDINIEPALARNQERLSDFYQSYKNEDSSIDWSKVATKITLSNTSGTFYDHEDKYTTGLKIEFSAQGVENIEFKDGTTGETIAKLTASQLPATMVIGNLCNINLQENIGNPQKVIVRDPPQQSFCSPTLSALRHLQLAGAPIWAQCSQCAVLYNTAKTHTNCFGTYNPNSPPPYYGPHTQYGKLIYLPFDMKPWQFNGLPTAENIAACGIACDQCGMLVYNSLSSTTALFPPPCFCPYNNQHHSWDHYTNAYWVQTEPITGTTSNGWTTCKVCNGLYLTTADVSCCYGSTPENPVAHIPAWPITNSITQQS